MAALLAAARAAAEGGSAEPRELKPGEAIEQVIAGGEEHQYRLPLASDTFVHIEVVERGVDLVVTARDPDDRKLRERNDDVVALCPELDVASQGDTIEEARANLKEAVELFLDAADPSEVEARLHAEVYVTRLDVAVG